MQTIILKATSQNGKALPNTRLILPCAWEELGCRTKEVNMLKHGNKYYNNSGADCSSKFVFEVKNNPQKHCGKPTCNYRTYYDSFYLDRVSEVLTWIPLGTWVVIKTEQPRSYDSCGKKRKATSVNFTLKNPH